MKPAQKGKRYLMEGIILTETGEHERANGIVRLLNDGFRIQADQ